MDVRARSFAERLSNDFEIRIAYRGPQKIQAIFQFWWMLLRFRPAVCYVFDMAFSGVLAAGFHRLLSRCRVAVDTGDAIYELGRLTGRKPFALWLTKMLEGFSFSISDRIVVRSHPHQELLHRQGISAEVIPDGVDTRQFKPRAEPDFRRRYKLEGFTTIGLLGSLIWNPRSQTCYGSELLEVIDRLRDRPVKGVIIGDGSGLPILKKQFSEHGLDDRIVFLGRIAYDDLPPYLNLMDICLSTQTNDQAGQVRTTGKLPLYLACGRFVLASEVGEAARVLPAAMLIPFEGTTDPEYAAKIAARVAPLLNNPERLTQPEPSVRIAQTHFEYDMLADRLRRTIEGLVSPVDERKQEVLAR
jgi:glycosyltransferase involved in cell wall biosynthesis